jgi:hypothetical protein
MKNTTNLNLASFNQFIVTDEAKRGYVISFKGESNTTLKKFFLGLFSLPFTRRITTFSSYNENAQRIITNNYVDRIKGGKINKYPPAIVKEFINELNKKYSKDSQSFWKQNTSKLVYTLRLLQRANCYLNALEGGFRNDEFVNDKFIPYKNPENSIKGAFLGIFNGFFGLRGMIGFIIAIGILWAILAIIVFIGELF